MQDSNLTIKILNPPQLHYNPLDDKRIINESDLEIPQYSPYFFKLLPLLKGLNINYEHLNDDTWKYLLGIVTNTFISKISAQHFGE